MKLPFYKEFDWPLFLIWLLLMICGVIAIFSASTLKVDTEINRSDFYVRQIIFVFLAIFIVIMILKIPTTIIDIMITPGYVVTFFMLIIVLFMPPINNSHRWISIAGVSIQPSEMAKLALILLSAKILGRDHITHLQKLFIPLIYSVIPFLLILRAPDLGTALVIVVAFLVMLAQAGFPLTYLLILISPIISILSSFYIPAFIVFACLLIFILFKKRMALHFIIFITIVNLFFLFITPVLWQGLKPYQQNRILTFVDPTRDPLNTGYQVIQARIAVGSGQTFGKGFLEGTQKNLNFLPEHHTDFIFSMISEEFGFVGAIALLTLFLMFFMRIIKNIFRAEVKERRIAMAGILGYLTFQVFINIGMNIGLMPTTGIPLPFISYGGSSLIVNSIAVALVLKYGQEKEL